MKYKTLIFWLIVSFSLLLFLQYNYKFHFYYIEQLQLFLFTKKYAADTIIQPGGLSLYISRFLIQFYHIPCIGAFITVILVVLPGIIMQLILKRMLPVSQTYLLCSISAFLLLLLHVDVHYKIQGTVAYLFMLSFLFIYTGATPFHKRLLIGLILLPVLFLIGGPVALLFGLTAILWEIINKQPKWYLSIIFGIEYFIIGLICIQIGWHGEYRMIVLPDIYYDPFVHQDNLYYSWFILPVTIITSLFFTNRKELKIRKENVFFVIQILCFFLFLYCFSAYNKSSLHSIKEQDYYLRSGQWDKIIETFPSTSNNVQMINVLNLALAKKGFLGNKLFHYPQQGAETVLSEWDNTLANALALSDIFYHIGDMATAQKLAFEGYVASVNNGNVRFLKRLVETNIVFGAYRVAEKYINLLDQTLFYKEWANYHRKYLNNDRAVEQDFIFGNKRKALINNNRYAVSGNTVEVLELLACNNPDNQIPIQYLAALCLTNRDLKKFRYLHKNYYHTKVWPELSISHQEAVIALEQENPSFWLHNGVSMKTEQRFYAFDEDIRKNRNQLDFVGIIESKYGNTYWYYLMFKKR